MKNGRSVLVKPDITTLQDACVSVCVCVWGGESVCGRECVYVCVGEGVGW